MSRVHVPVVFTNGRFSTVHRRQRSILVIRISGQRICVVLIAHTLRLRGKILKVTRNYLTTSSTRLLRLLLQITQIYIIIRRKVYDWRQLSILITIIIAITIT
jgi:hypothetical protein